MSDHIPTTEFIREAANVNGSIGVSYSEFDHWMEAHDREVAAKALRDAAGSPIPREALATGTRAWLRARADQIEEGSNDK